MVEGGNLSCLEILFVFLLTSTELWLSYWVDFFNLAFLNGLYSVGLVFSCSRMNGAGGT